VHLELRRYTESLGDFLRAWEYLPAGILGLHGYHLGPAATHSFWWVFCSGGDLWREDAIYFISGGVHALPPFHKPPGLVLGGSGAGFYCLPAPTSLPVPLEHGTLGLLPGCCSTYTIYAFRPFCSFILLPPYLPFVQYRYHSFLDFPEPF